MAEQKLDSTPVDQIEAGMAEQKVDCTQIDAGLGRYYAQKGVDGYFDSDGVGKFKLYCDRNGFDKDLINEDLKLSVEESQLMVCLLVLLCCLSFPSIPHS